MGKKEISEDMLQKLLESHETLQQMQEQEIDRKEAEAKAKLENLNSTSAILNGWGPMLMLVGVASIAAAPALLNVAWIYGDLMAAMLATAGKISTVTGSVLTGKSLLNRWVVKQKQEALIALGIQQDILLLE